MKNGACAPPTLPTPWWVPSLGHGPPCKDEETGALRRDVTTAQGALDWVGICHSHPSPMPTPGILELSPCTWGQDPTLAGSLGLGGWEGRALACQGPEQQSHLQSAHHWSKCSFPQPCEVPPHGGGSTDPQRGHVSHRCHHFHTAAGRQTPAKVTQPVGGGAAS